MPIGIGLLGLVFLGGLFVLLGVGVALLFRRGTWPIGLVLIGFPVVVVFFGIGLFWIGTPVSVYRGEAISPPPRVVTFSTGPRVDAIQREQEAKAEALRQQLERGRIRIEKAQERIAKSHPKPPVPPKPIKIDSAEESKPVETSVVAKSDAAKPGESKSDEEKPAKGAAEAVVEEAVPKTAEQAPAENLPTEKPQATTVPVNSVTTFGLIVRALATAIDSELPSNISGDEALVALEETVNEELPAGTSRSGLISALGRVIGKAVAEKHEEIAFEGDDEKQADLPDWAKAPARTVNGAYRMFVKVGPFSTDLECENALPSALDMAANDYVGLLIGEQARAAGVSLPQKRLETLVVEKYEQQITSSVGPMLQLYALVEFDGKTQAMLREEWKNVQIRDRLIVAGLGFGGVFVLIAAGYGFLRLDLATEGKARGRILFAVIAIAVLLGIFVPRIVSSLNDRGALEGATDLLSVSTVSETATETAGGGAYSATPASWAMVGLTVLFIVGAALCFRAGTRKWGVALLIFCGILFGTGLLLVA